MLSSPNRLLKKAKTRLLMHAVQNHDCVFAGGYRTATVREPVPDGLFSSLLWLGLRLSLRLLNVAENDLQRKMLPGWGDMQ